MANERERRLIVCDGKYWYVRHVRAVEYSLERDEKVYHCDRPIGTRYAKLADVPEVAKLLRRRKP